MLKILAFFTLLCSLGQIALAQKHALPQTNNAALRYWMAFGLMQDSPSDSNTVAVLERVTNGSGDWDDALLGPLIEKNAEAVLTMQRATRLPECNWGFEYELGPAAPVANLPKARVLARLNTLYGLRSLAHHDNKSAVDSWIAGIRFSQHLAQNSPLLGILTAKAGLISQFRVIRRAAPMLNSDDKKKLALQIQSLSTYSFDWGQAVTIDGMAGEIAFRRLATSDNPREMYRTWFGEAMPESANLPSEGDISRYRDVMTQAAAAFRLPYESAKERLAVVDKRMKELNPIVQQIVPSLNRMNESRHEVEDERQRVLESLGAR